MRPIARHFIRNIELWLSAAGLLVVWLVAALAAPAEADYWKIAALTALGISVLHGTIFWVVRRRQRRVREMAIAEIREMLADVVKNQLAVIGMWLPEKGEEDAIGEGRLDGIQDSVGQIEALIDTISEDSLASWKSRYADSLEHCEPFSRAA